MDTVDLIALTLGASWASGINLYAAMLVLGWMGSTKPPCAIHHCSDRVHCTDDLVVT